MKKIAVWMCCDENGSDANELSYQTFFSHVFNFFYGLDEINGLETERKSEKMLQAR